MLAVPFFVLAACGGGSVSINQQNHLRSKIPAVPLLDKFGVLSARGDYQTIADHLSELQGEPGDKFDWEGFWSGLTVRPYRKTLLEKQRTALLSLHGRDCEAFPAYVRFLLEVRDGWDTLVGDGRRCDRRLPAELSMAVAQAMVADHPELAAPAFRFLSAEMRHSGNGDGWAAAYPTGLPWIWQTGRKLLAQGDLKTVLDLFQAQTATREGDLALSELALLAVTDDKLREPYLSAVGTEAALRRVTEALLNDRVRRPGLAGVGGFENAASKMLASGEIDSAYLVRVARLAFSVREFRSAQELSVRLAAWDGLLAVAEKRILEVDESSRTALFETAAASAGSAPWRFELSWLARRASVILPTVESTRSDELETALGLLADLERGKVAALGRYCDYLQSHGISSISADAQTLRELLSRGSLLGCFRLTEAADLQSDSSLSAFSSSVIFANDASVSLSAPAIRLGAVFLRTTHKPPPMIPTPPPPASNARVVPLLVGISLSKDSVRFKRGTHFFVMHFVDREAKAGGPEPKQPLSGFPGPDLALRSDAPVAKFPFVSLGGPGQSAAPAQPGGLGDKSSASVEEMVGWLDTLSLGGRIPVPRPVRFQSQLNYDLLDFLFTEGDREAQGLKIYVVPEFLNLLDKQQLTKWHMLCEETLGRQLKREDIAACVRERVAPRALQQIAALVERSRSDGSLARDVLMPELNAEEVFRLSGAAEGPANPVGADGAPGRLTVGGFSEGDVP